MAESERDRRGTHEESDGLKVTDRRLFTADGQLRAETPDEPAEAEALPRARETEPSDFERRPVEEPQGVDVTMLINAMAEPALLFLGEIRPPGEQPHVDLERARIQIDMLDLLRVKCRGNLSAAEEGLLDRVLYQLRMLYVSRANAPRA
jgi:hypothetical protein